MLVSCDGVELLRQCLLNPAGCGTHQGTREVCLACKNYGPKLSSQGQIKEREMNK